jgi:hypothetical protein
MIVESATWMANGHICIYIEREQKTTCCTFKLKPPWWKREEDTFSSTLVQKFLPLDVPNSM